MAQSIHKKSAHPVGELQRARQSQLQLQTSPPAAAAAGLHNRPRAVPPKRIQPFRKILVPDLPNHPESPNPPQTIAAIGATGI